MNYSSAYAFAGKLFDKVSQDFWNKHPGALIGTGIFVIALPYLQKGAKYCYDEAWANFRYWVDAKYPKPMAVVLEEADPVLFSEPTVA